MRKSALIGGALLLEGRLGRIDRTALAFLPKETRAFFRPSECRQRNSIAMRRCTRERVNRSGHVYVAASTGLCTDCGAHRARPAHRSAVVVRIVAMRLLAVSIGKTRTSAIHACGSSLQLRWRTGARRRLCFDSLLSSQARRPASRMLLDVNERRDLSPTPHSSFASTLLSRFWHSWGCLPFQVPADLRL